MVNEVSECDICSVIYLEEQKFDKEKLNNLMTKILPNENMKIGKWLKQIVMKQLNKGWSD